MDVEDRHSIYLMAGGHTREDVEAQVEAWVTSPAVQGALAAAGASDDYLLSWRPSRAVHPGGATLGRAP